MIQIFSKTGSLCEVLGDTPSAMHPIQCPVPGSSALVAIVFHLPKDGWCGGATFMLLRQASSLPPDLPGCLQKYLLSHASLVATLRHFGRRLLGLLAERSGTDGNRQRVSGIAFGDWSDNRNHPFTSPLQPISYFAWRAGSLRN